MGWRAGVMFCAVALAGLSGCATVTGGAPDHLAVRTNVDSTCTIRDSAGTRRFKAPGTVAAKPKHTPAVVSCQAPGYEPASVTVSRKTRAATAGNILIGGIIGLAIDAGTGNHLTFDGPAELSLQPRQVTRAAPPQTLPRQPVRAPPPQRTAVVRPPAATPRGVAPTPVVVRPGPVVRPAQASAAPVLKVAYAPAAAPVPAPVVRPAGPPGTFRPLPGPGAVAPVTPPVTHVLPAPGAQPAAHLAPDGSGQGPAQGSAQAAGTTAGMRVASAPRGVVYVPAAPAVPGGRVWTAAPAPSAPAPAAAPGPFRPL